MNPLHLRANFNLRLVSLIISALFLLVFVMRVPSQAGFFLLNCGSIALNHSLVQEDTSSVTYQLATAQSRFSQAIQWLSDGSRSWRGLGLTKFVKGDFVNALRAWQHVKWMPMELLEWGHKARIYGDTQIALQWYEFAQQLNDSLVDASYYIGLTHLIDGNVIDARIAFEKGLQQTQYDSIQKGDLYFRLGQSYARAPNSDLDQAVAFFDKALLTNKFETPGAYARVLFARGDALQRLGSVEEAFRAYRSVLQVDENHYWARVRLAMLTWNQKGKLAETERLLLEAIALDPNNKWAFRNLGNIYEVNGRFSEAENMYYQALLIDPDDLEVSERLNLLLNVNNK